MSVKLNFLNKASNKPSSNLILFVDESLKPTNLKKYLPDSEFSYIEDLVKTADSKKSLLKFDISSKKKIVIVIVKKSLKDFDIENLGAELYKKVNNGKSSEFNLISDSFNGKNSNFIGHLLHGLKLKSYEFNKYKTKKESRIKSINVIGNKNKTNSNQQLKFKALEEGTFYARDLVSEPGNILHPDEYAKRISSLKKFGLKITVCDDKKLKSLGMNALLGVGQGSIRGSYLVIMEWKGLKNDSKPLAFVVGVCFDTGGYFLNQQNLWKT